MNFLALHKIQPSKTFRIFRLKNQNISQFRWSKTHLFYLNYWKQIHPIFPKALIKPFILLLRTKHWHSMQIVLSFCLLFINWNFLRQVSNMIKFEISYLQIDPDVNWFDRSLRCFTMGQPIEFTKKYITVKEVFYWHCCQSKSCACVCFTTSLSPKPLITEPCLKV